jgi:hypothetical protein
MRWKFENKLKFENEVNSSDSCMRAHTDIQGHNLKSESVNSSNFLSALPSAHLLLQLQLLTDELINLQS